MAKTIEIDEQLAAGLKAAKAKRMYFAVALKGGTDGALVIGKEKIPPGDIAAAKKKCGGSAVIQGACFGEDGKHTFEMAKVPPATLANALKFIAHRDSGLTIHPECRLGTSADLPDDGNAAAAPVGTGAAPSKAAATQPVQKAVAGPLPGTAKYEAALKTWEKASAAALSAVDKLVAALEATGDEVAISIASIIKQLQASFPDTLDESLTNLAKAAKSGSPGDTETYRVRSEIAIKAALAFLNNNAQTIEGCEHNPFGIAVPFRAALTEALKQVLIGVK
jgi:hypothetical protein